MNSSVARAGLCLGLTTGTALAGLAAAADLSQLDRLLQAGDTVALAREFRSGQYPASELVPWLRRQAEAGHALPQYELAERLKGDRLDEALGWYARGRLARLLDEEECNRTGRTNAAGVGWVLDLGYQDLDRLAKSNEPSFLKGMAAALGEKPAGAAPSAKWICGSEANLLPQAEAQAARAKLRERLERRRDQIASEVAASELPINPDGFEIKHLPKGYPQPGVMTWLDNQRLLFGSREARPHGAPYAAIPFFVWDVSTGKIEPVAHDIGYYFCYWDGYVRYTVQEGSFAITKAGRWGEEQEVLRRRLRDDSGQELPSKEIADPPPVNPFNCRTLNDKQRAEMPKRRPLHDGHGSLGSRAHEDRRYRFALYPPDGGKAIDLPIETDFRSERYAQFAGAYYFSFILHAPERDPVPFWTFFPDGRAMMTPIPYGPWQHAGRGYALTRAGVYFWSHRVTAGDGEIGIAGAYLARGNQVTRLLRGYKMSDAVSPDGCRIAFAYSLGKSLSHWNDLSVIDLCSKGDTP